MKNRTIKWLALTAMLALCLLLTGCVVPPDDLSNSGDLTNDNPFANYQSIAPQVITPSPTPYTPAGTPIPEATVNWGTTPTPTVRPMGNTGGYISVITPSLSTPSLVTPAPATTKPGTATSLKLGDDNDDVRKMQTRLKELGYLKGSADGDFGSATEAAVKAFQAQNNLTVDGKAGTRTLTLLYSSSAKRAPAAVTATPTVRITSVPDTNVYLEDGSSGAKVRQLQNRLIELGWMDGKADGVYSGATEYAVKAFQKQYKNLDDDGVAGPSTLTTIYGSRAAKASTPASSVGETLKEGTASDAVRAMQQRLKDLGYLSGSADGAFGQGTKAAVIAFQTANGLKADGKAGTTTLNALYSKKAKSAETLNDDATSGSTSDDDTLSHEGYRTLKEGDEGKDVSNLQRALKNRGYYSGSIDGKYGSGTVAAVMAFQQRNGLTVDGKAGPTTQRVLYASAGSSSTGNTGSTSGSIYDTLRPGDSSTYVRNMQYALYELGYYDGKVDGSYGNTTEDAVRAFQIRNGLTPVDGIAGKKTLQKLYSGSAVAAPTANTVYTTLRKGDRGDPVVQMQDSLQQLGYLSEVTGFYDDATVEAVKNFQRRNSLKVDGTAGQETLYLLYMGKPRTAY